MTTSDPWLVLFDIDGTLVQTGRAGVRGMNAAFARLHGVERALDGVPVAGRTDRAIVSDVLGAHGLPTTESEIFRLREAYLADLTVEISRPVADPSGVLAGVDSLLETLERQRDTVTVGLLTGNFEGGAAIKLRKFDLQRRFRFGAFGDHHVDRRALVPIAMARAKSAGTPVTPDHVVIIGDTPLDVDCARAHGAHSIAVATGLYDRAALSAAGAGLVVDTLADRDAIFGWMAGL